MTRNGLILALTAVVAAALALSACGRKGPLERPPHAKEKAEKPTPQSDATVRGPNRPFVLDRLLQ